MKNRILHLFGSLLMFNLALPAFLSAGDSWSFDVERDSFLDDSLLDLRHLNEEAAGETGWIEVDEDGDFVRGDGEIIRFWAVGTNVKEGPAREQPHWEVQSLDHQAKWLAKRGVNMVRTHAFINPDEPSSEGIDEVDEQEVAWIWKVVGTMKKQGIYTTVSPYWANNMKSDDTAWGTDWQGQHHALLFFEEELIEAYKGWLRYLFTTPNEFLDGKTLAEESALALFQIQNEDSLLFWTINNLTEGQADRLGALFAEWASQKYGNLNEALLHWGGEAREGDQITEGILGFANIWELTGSAALFENPRLADQLEFWVQHMRAFNQEIARFVREELGCPVLINAGNWKTADNVLLNDAERYSYTANEVIAVNRYFNAMHEGPYKGWAIVAGDFYQNKSVLRDGALDFPLNLKQVQGHPMLVTESTWVYPMKTGFEAPLLVAAYSSLSGVDAYYWFNSGVDDFEQPRSANGYLEESQTMWLCMNPDMAGQWPAAALMFRKGLLQQGEPVVVEHRSLASLWHRRTPLIAESASFDPNRDAGNVAEGDPFLEGVSPWAFFVGPVETVFESDASQSTVAENLKELIDPIMVQSQDEQGNLLEETVGMRVTSNTNELVLDTEKQLFTMNAPGAQGMISYAPVDVHLEDVILTTQSKGISVVVVAMDGRSIAASKRVLVQVGTPSRPNGWTEAEATFEDPKSGRIHEGLRIESVGAAPWMVEKPILAVIFKNMTFDQVKVLDMNGVPIRELALIEEPGTSRLNFPQDAMYVLLSRDMIED